MREALEPRVPAARKRRPPREPSRCQDWASLFRRTHVHDALQEIAFWLDGEGDVDLLLEITDPPREVARHEGTKTGRGTWGRDAIQVHGVPIWRLRARRSGGRSPSAEGLRRGASALEAWRAARAESLRTEGRLELRTRELDLLQAMGRIAAEARTADELFAAGASVLETAAGTDVVAVAHVLDGSPEARVFLGCPVDDPAIHDVVRCAGSVLGWAAEERPGTRVDPLDAFDAHRGRRGTIRDHDLLVAPLFRRGVPVASLVVLPCGAADEGAVRLFFGIANQLSLHLDRILTIREAEEGRFRSILESMPQAVILTDAGLRVLQRNPAASKLLRSLGIADARGIVERIGDLDLRPLASEILEGRKSSAGGEAQPGGGIVLDVTLSGVTSGAPEGLVLVLADVTESRRLQERLGQAEKLSSLGQMISGIAHELNNPLASVLGYAQLLHASATDDGLARRLEVVHQEARRCQRIVHNLLSFARQHEPERKLLSLNEVVNSVLGLLGYQLRVDGIRVQAELGSDLPPIHGDFHQLQQALLNLVTNAQHALRSAGNGGTLTVRTSPGGHGLVRLEVEDDGPGIPEAIHSRIFDPFFTTKATGQGTGLGLSIVYGIVASHDGSIQVDSRTGKGASFRVELPVGAPSCPERGEGVAPRRPSPVTRGRILVVDDEEPVARLICEALAEEGHDAVPALDSRQALDRLAVEEFDLIIADMKMPGMSVGRLREELERVREGLSRRLLLTTGDTVSREPAAFAEKEGLGLIHKPFDLDDLRRTVRSWLEANGEQGSCGT